MTATACHELIECSEFSFESGPAFVRDCHRGACATAVVRFCDLDVPCVIEDIKVTTEVAIGELECVSQIRELGAPYFVEDHKNSKAEPLMYYLIELPDNVRLIHCCCLATSFR